MASSSWALLLCIGVLAPGPVLSVWRNSGEAAPELAARTELAAPGTIDTTEYPIQDGYQSRGRKVETVDREVDFMQISYQNDHPDAGYATGLSVEQCFVGCRDAGMNVAVPQNEYESVQIAKLAKCHPGTSSVLLGIRDSSVQLTDGGAWHRNLAFTDEYTGPTNWKQGGPVLNAKGGPGHAAMIWYIGGHNGQWESYPGQGSTYRCVCESKPRTVITCNLDGTSYEFEEIVTDSTRTVNVNWCPNHYSAPEGHLNPNYAVGQDSTIQMPARPRLESTRTVSLETQGGGVGVLFDGAMLYSPYAGVSIGEVTGDSTSATRLEGNTFDKCGEHSSSTTAPSYHAHVPPSCLLHQLGQKETEHSPQIGWAPDGFPVYGPRTVDGNKIKLCAASNTETTYCMDECNGLEMELPELDSFKYRYYVSGHDYLDPKAIQSCNGATQDCINPLPTKAYYPFTPRCYKGCCPSDATCSGTNAAIPVCSGTAQAGTVTSYTPAAKYPNGLPTYIWTDFGAAIAKRQATRQRYVSLGIVDHI